MPLFRADASIATYAIPYKPANPQDNRFKFFQHKDTKNTKFKFYYKAKLL